MTVQHEIEVNSQVEANQEAENESVCNFVDAQNFKHIHLLSTIDFEHLMFFFHCLGPASYDLSFKCKVLAPED